MMTEEMKKELEVIFQDPMFAWINEESVKKMQEVVRDVFPKATKNEIAACLESSGILPKILPKRSTRN